MKKLLYLFVAGILLLGSQLMVYALDEDEVDEDNVTTEEETSNVTNIRTLFLENYLEKKAELLSLREQTKEARLANNALVAQIKTLIKNKDRTAIEAKVQEIETLRVQIKAVVDEAKTYVAQKQELKKQLATAIKNGQTEDIATYTTQRDGVISKLVEYKATLTTYRSDLKTLIDELKTYRTEERNKYSELKTLYLETKNLHTEIVAEEILKNQKWDEFRAAIGEKNYGKATEAFDAIIAHKASILENIKAKNILLQEIIDQYNAE